MAAARRHRLRPTTWLLIVFTALMALWFFSGVGSFCDDYSGAALEACHDGEFGYDLAQVVILGLWLWGTVLLGIVWLFTRRRFTRRREASAAE